MTELPYIDEPVFFPAGHETLFGMLTSPRQRPCGVAVVLVRTGGAGRNRVMVRLAHELAEIGFHVLRFDLQGLGESSGVEVRAALVRPDVVAPTAAIEFLRTRGFDRFVLGGQCFGARSALAATPRVRGLLGAVFITVPVWDWGWQVSQAGPTTGQLAARALRPTVARGLFDRSRRAGYRAIVLQKSRSVEKKARRVLRTPMFGDELVSFRVLRPLRGLVSRGVPVLFVNGDDNVGAVFERARAGVFGRFLARHSDRIQVVSLPGEVHVMVDVSMQERAIRAVHEWCATLVTSPRAHDNPDVVSTPRGIAAR